MPEAHRQYLDTQDLLRRVASAGPATEELITLMMQRLRHPVLCYRSLMGLAGLARRRGPERLEAACRRALESGAHRYSSIASILKHVLMKRPAPQDETPAIQHNNIRGPSYYDTTTPNGDAHAYPSHP